MVLVGLNLRPLLTSVSPLLPDIRAATGMGFRTASLLTVLPVVMMGAVALLGARIHGAIGDRYGIAAGLATIALACGYRYVAVSTPELVASAVVAGSGVAIIQALMPGMIKRCYPTSTTLVMGWYAAALMGGGGLGAMLSPWGAQWMHDWHAGLGMWAVLAGSTLAWWMVARIAAAPVVMAAPPSQGFCGSRRAWLLALYFGWLNGAYTSLVAWLPAFYAERGWSMQQSGALLATMTALQVVAGLLLPLLSRRRIDRRPWLALGLIAQCVGFAGLITAPYALPFAWIAILGFGLGATFSMGLILALDHLPDPRRAGELTAFVQGIGFMLAALSPLITGLIRDMTGSFIAAWWVLAGSSVALLVITLRFHPDSYVAAIPNG